MKKSLIIGTIILIMTATSALIGYYYGYKQPPYRLISATQINTTDYSLELEDHQGHSFFLCVPIEKAVAMGIDTNVIIILSNQ